MSKHTARMQNRNRRGFAPRVPVLAEIADRNENGTARHLDRERDLDELQDLDQAWDANRDAMRAVSRELHKLQRTLLKVSERVNSLIEHQDRLNTQLDALRCRDRRRNQEDLREHRETGRICCTEQMAAAPTRRQQAKVIVQDGARVDRMEVR